MANFSAQRIYTAEQAGQVAGDGFVGPNGGPALFPNGAVIGGGASSTSYSTLATAPAANNVALTVAQITGGAAFVALDYTGAATGAFTLTTPTAAAILAALPAADVSGDVPEPEVGQSYLLRVLNAASGQTATLAGGAGVTVTGTATIATGTWREFIVTVTGAATVTLQNVGGGSID